MSSFLTLNVFWIRPDLLQVTIIKKLKSICYYWINPKSDCTVAAFQSSVFYSHQISVQSGEGDFQVSVPGKCVHLCINICTNHNIPTWWPEQQLFHIWRVQFQHPEPWSWHNHHMTGDEITGISVNAKNFIEKKRHKRHAKEMKTHPAPDGYPVLVYKTHVYEFSATHTNRNIQTNPKGNLHKWVIYNRCSGLARFIVGKSVHPYLTAVIWSSTSSVPSCLLIECSIPSPWYPLPLPSKLAKIIPCELERYVPQFSLNL